MKKILYKIFAIVSALALTIASFSDAFASRAAVNAPIRKYFDVTSAVGLKLETSGTAEKVTPMADGWLTQAGGVDASTHYARLKYKLPENDGVALTYFYTRAVVNFPPDFYSQHKAGFRILSTDNYPTTLNGAPIGAVNANELRVSVYMNSDQKLRILVNHETVSVTTLYTAPSILPTGDHTFELAGDLANSAPWYFKVDGVVVASGVARLSPDTTTVPERVATRIVAGIDGAASQDLNPMSLTVKSLEFANYDPYAAAAPTSVPPTSIPPTVTQPPTTVPATATSLPPTSVLTIAPTKIPATPTTVPPTATAQPTNTPATQPQPTTTVVAPPSTTGSIDVRVSSGADDVEEKSSGGMYVSSSDLELIYDTSTQLVGIRFTGVKIPKGATITNAYIQFRVNDVSTQSITLAISGEASANPAAFVSVSRNVSKRIRTTNKVTWSPAPWATIGEAGVFQRTPNLKSIVQELVNQSGWNSGNAMVIIITGSSGKRAADAFEGNAAGAPLLHVEYTTP